MKASKKKLMEWSREEKRTSKMYRKYGFGSFAKDEAKHSKGFRKLAKKRK